MPTSILIINPNSSQSVTDGLEQALQAPPETTLTFYTAPPNAPPSINDITGGTLSATACFLDIIEKGLIDKYDGFLVSCCEYCAAWEYMKTRVTSSRQSPITH
jgi:Asp/Glu/hydantoin racemase